MCVWKYKIGFSAGLVYSYAKAFPSKSSDLKVSSASSQSYSDATKYDEKKDSLWWWILDVDVYCTSDTEHISILYFKITTFI